MPRLGPTSSERISSDGDLEISSSPRPLSDFLDPGYYSPAMGRGVGASPQSRNDLSDAGYCSPEMLGGVGASARSSGINSRETVGRVGASPLSSGLNSPETVRRAGASPLSLGLYRPRMDRGANRESPIPFRHKPNHGLISPATSPARPPRNHSSIETDVSIPPSLDKVAELPGAKPRAPYSKEADKLQGHSCHLSVYDEPIVKRDASSAHDSPFMNIRAVEQQGYQSLSSAQVVERGAFENNQDLVSVAIAEGTIFQSEVFLNCRNLRTIIFEGQYISIGKDGFKGCENLKVIFCSPRIEAYLTGNDNANAKVFGIPGGVEYFRTVRTHSFLPYPIWSDRHISLDGKALTAGNFSFDRYQLWTEIKEHHSMQKTGYDEIREKIRYILLCLQRNNDSLDEIDNIVIGPCCFYYILSFINIVPANNTCMLKDRHEVAPARAPVVSLSRENISPYSNLFNFKVLI